MSLEILRFKSSAELHNWISSLPHKRNRIKLLRRESLTTAACYSITSSAQRTTSVYLFLPPQQHSLLNQLLLELQTLV